MAKICFQCVKEPNLIRFVKTKGLTDICSICGNKGLSVDSNENDFVQLVKALVRFNYSEWDYNHHLGGDDYESLFHGNENIFFNIERQISEDVYDDMVVGITEMPVYENYEDGVSVFSGYGDNGMRNMPLRSIKSDLDLNLIEVSQRLKTENYFVLENEVKTILNGYAKIASKNINMEECFFRARVGYKDKKISLGLGFEAEDHFSPYVTDDIGAPPPSLASGGRINRPGVSFFYCATDKYTAVSEVRPHPGDLVSIGKFSLKRNVKLYDLSGSQLIHFFNSDSKLERYIPFNTLGILINKTIPPSERQHYSITQLISDCIRQLGFDGIKFSSTVGSGENIVLFEPLVAEYTTDEANVFIIKEVNYEYQEVKLITDGSAYK